METGGLRSELYRAPELLDRFGAAFAAQQRDAEKVVPLRMPRREAQRETEVTFGVGVTAGFEALRAGS